MKRNIYITAQDFLKRREKWPWGYCDQDGYPLVEDGKCKLCAYREEISKAAEVTAAKEQQKQSHKKKDAVGNKSAN